MSDCPFGIVAGLAPVKPGRDGSRTSPGRRRDVDEAQLHPLLAVPAIDCQRSGRVDGAPTVVEQRRAELLAGGPEGDDVDGRAVAGAQARAQVGLSGLLHIGELMTRQGQDRLRIAGPEWPRL